MTTNGRVPLTQEVRFCTSRDGVRLAYGITGSGPPLVSPGVWASHLQLDPLLIGFRHWIEGLSRHQTLIRADLRGSGLSDWEVPSMGFEDWVGDLEAMVDDAGLDRFPILGLSAAGATAVAYAVRHPERVTHLILYAAAAQAAVPPSDRPRPKWDAYLAFYREFWDSTLPQMQLFYTGNVIPAGSPEILAAMDEVRRKAMSPENAAAAIETMATTDVMDLLPQIQAPTLVLQPKRGSPVDIKTAREVAAAIPRARLVLLEADNHLIQEYEPGWPVLLEETWRFLGVSDARMNGHRDGAASSPFLSEREREVLALIALHRTNAQIADALTIAPATASRHVHNILEKLGMSRRSEAAAYALREGLVD